MHISLSQWTVYTTQLTIGMLVIIPYNRDTFHFSTQGWLGISKRKGYEGMFCRGIRGATTVEHNDRESIITATIELLQLIVERNELQLEDIASVIFTMTQDLDAEFPALAARSIGWTEVPLMCMREIPVPGSLSSCIRVLLHVNTTRSGSEMQHIYIREAVSLRPNINSRNS